MSFEDGYFVGKPGDCLRILLHRIGAAKFAILSNHEGEDEDGCVADDDAVKEPVEIFRVDPM